MKAPFYLAFVATCVGCLIQMHHAEARGFSRGGSRGASRPSVSRPSPRPSYRPSQPVKRPSPSQRPSFGGGSSGGGTRLPSMPTQRPSTRPELSRPAPSYRPQPQPSRPSIPTTRPSVPTTRPSVPTTRPSVPTTRPSVPTTRPSLPTTRPSIPEQRPGNDLGLRPSNPPKLPDRPTTLPDRPVQLPERPGNGSRPGIGDRPVTLPARPGDGNRPGIGDRPGNGSRPTVPNPPGRPERPPRPEWGDRWQGNDNKFTNISNKWNSDNTTIINNFQVNRSNQWNSVSRRWNEPGWHRQWGTSAYRSWRHDVWGFRGNRCREIWYRTGPFHYHNSFFNVHWFGSCWWHPQPIRYRCSPWWWWRPVAWTSVGFFFGSALASDPVVYDPGTTVIYEGDTVYINGESAGSAETYREETIALGNPDLESFPFPEPPETPDGAEVDDDPESPTGDWLPVGVWALTQQEQGDATMFFQLSIDKNGIVGGAYKNVLTGDEQPVYGQLDFESQRVAWHVGDATTTVYETGLSSLEKDVASVFVHFGETQTQTWLLVRMPSPENPPADEPEVPSLATN